MAKRSHAAVLGCSACTEESPESILLPQRILQESGVESVDALRPLCEAPDDQASVGLVHEGCLAGIVGRLAGIRGADEQLAF